MKPQRILVIEDHPVNLKLMVNLLESENYIVDQAENAESAINLLQTIQPDLILMDIALPGIDGLTLTRQLKENQMTRHIPIIALTAFAMKGDQQIALDAGCEDYITKPIETRKLPQKIALFLAARKH